MMGIKNIIGERFGRLVVIKEVPKPIDKKTKGRYYLCQCDCGNEKIANRTILLSGGILSCGCLKKERVSAAVTINLENQIFGKLKVLKKVPFEQTPPKCEAMWECQCECGNIVRVRGTSLTNGNTKSCGCLQKQIASEMQLKDEIGNKYGRLTVVSFDHSDKKNAYWKCCCDCGNFVVVKATNLRNGHVQSCGCIHSIGEMKIHNLLEVNKINFKTQFTFKNLVSSREGIPRFDFAIFSKNKQLVCLIEYQGEQHTDKNSYYYTKELEDNDNLKKDYCKKNNIDLIFCDKKTDLTNLMEEIKEKILKYDEEG